MADPITPVEKLLDRLRAGHPEGVPPHDYIALFGIPHRSLLEIVPGASSGVGRD